MATTKLNKRLYSKATNILEEFDGFCSISNYFDFEVDGKTIDHLSLTHEIEFLSGDDPIFCPEGTCEKVVLTNEQINDLLEQFVEYYEL
jgi:hypothetical protein